MGEGTPQQVIVDLDAGSDSRFVTLSRYVGLRKAYYRV